MKLNKNIGKFISGTVAAVALLTIPAFAEEVTNIQAERLAESYLPSDKILVETDINKREYQLDYYSESRQEEYRITVSRTVQRVLEFESNIPNANGGRNVTLTEEQAKQVVLREIAGARVHTIYLDSNDLLKEYQVTYTSDKSYGKYTIHPESGNVLKRDIVFLNKSQSNTTSTSATNTQTNQNQQPVDQTQQQMNQTGIDAYASSSSSTGSQTQQPVDQTQQQTNQTQQPAAQTPVDPYGSQSVTPTPPANSGTSTGIGLEKAKQIARQQAPAGATIVKWEYDWEYGRPCYEIELRKGWMEYEYKIDANSGTIIAYDVDYD